MTYEECREGIIRKNRRFKWCLSKEEVDRFPRRNEFVETYNWIQNNEWVSEINKDPRNEKVQLFYQLARIVKYFDPNEVGNFKERIIDVREFPNKSDNIEYFTLAYGEKEATRRMEEKSCRVKGSNNPAYDHGGKLSPFSKKFVKYKDEEDVEGKISETIEKSKNTKLAHPENESTKIEFYLAKGMTKEEAKHALSERQRTFSLKKCIEKFGDIEGRERWAMRQLKWRESFEDITLEEEFDRYRKQSLGSKNSIKKMLGVDEGFLYIATFEKFGERYIKVGWTTSTEKRKKSLKTGEKVESIEMIHTSKIEIDKAYELEGVILRKFKDILVYQDEVERFKINHPYETMKWSNEIEDKLKEEFYKMVSENDRETVV